MMVIPELDARLGSGLHKFSQAERNANRWQLIIGVFAHLDPGFDEENCSKQCEICNQ
jgi:hypothetical protein